MRKTIKERVETVRPLKKGICPECKTKMTKTKKGWLCYHCGTGVDYK